jgi:RNA polymerase sigma factor (sigma-70 family)
MHEKSDAQLLSDYAQHGDETAFAELVSRHTNLVYSAAWRQVGSPEIAAEVTQSVFIGLARGSRSLSPRLSEDASLAGWLCRSARNISLNLRRDEFRRHSRERQAMEHFDSTPETVPDWEGLCPVLDAAMSELDETDYDALVMRFFKNQDLQSVGLALGVSDDCAQKRVSRALDKLREHLSRHGISTSAAALSVVLTANAVQAAPVGLTVTISTAATLAGTTLTTTATAIATKTIVMTTLQKAVIAVSITVAVGAVIYEARQASTLHSQNQLLQKQQAPPTPITDAHTYMIAPDVFFAGLQQLITPKVGESHQQLLIRYLKQQDIYLEDTNAVGIYLQEGTGATGTGRLQVRVTESDREKVERLIVQIAKAK